MRGYRLQPRVVAMLDEIYAYSLERWGKSQADDYVAGFFNSFDRIASRDVVWRPVPAPLDVKGFQHRRQRHLIYWRLDSDGTVIVFAILHEIMHVQERLHEVLSEETLSSGEQP